MHLTIWHFPCQTFQLNITFKLTYFLKKIWTGLELWNRMYYYTITWYLYNGCLVNCFHCFYLFILSFLKSFCMIRLHMNIVHWYYLFLLITFIICWTLKEHFDTTLLFLFCVCVCVQTVDFYYLFGKDLFKNVFQLKDVVHVETTKQLK